MVQFAFICQKFKINKQIYLIRFFGYFGNSATTTTWTYLKRCSGLLYAWFVLLFDWCVILAILSKNVRRSDSTRLLAVPECLTVQTLWLYQSVQQYQIVWMYHSTRMSYSIMPSYNTILTGRPASNKLPASARAPDSLIVQDCLIVSYWLRVPDCLTLSSCLTQCVTNVILSDEWISEYIII